MINEGYHSANAIALQSSFLVLMSFDADVDVLRVRIDEHDYYYCNVPSEVAEGLAQATAQGGSAGQFYRYHVMKGCYCFAKRPVVA